MGNLCFLWSSKNRKRRKQFQSLCGFGNEFCAYKVFCAGVVKHFAQTLHQQFGADITHSLGAPLGILTGIFARSFANNVLVDGRVFLLQKEPYIEHIARRQPFTHSAEFVGEHIGECQHTDVGSGKGECFIVVVVLSSRYFHF